MIQMVLWKPMQLQLLIKQHNIAHQQGILKDLMCFLWMGHVKAYLITKLRGDWSVYDSRYGGLD